MKRTVGLCRGGERVGWKVRKKTCVVGSRVPLFCSANPRHSPHPDFKALQMSEEKRYSIS